MKPASYTSLAKSKNISNIVFFLKHSQCGLNSTRSLGHCTPAQDLYMRRTVWVLGGVRGVEKKEKGPPLYKGLHGSLPAPALLCF